MILALDTATALASVAVVDRGKVLAKNARVVTTHAEGLLTLVRSTLVEAGATIEALEAIVCGSGPGSFTGLRIGMATAKGLCMAAGLPLIAQGSMQALAHAVCAELGDQQLVAVIVDARRHEVFFGAFRGGEPLGHEVAIKPERVVDELAAMGGEAVIAGDGVATYRQSYFSSLTLAPPSCQALCASHLALVALPRIARGDFDDIHRAAPRYVRAPDIRKPKPAVP